MRRTLMLGSAALAVAMVLAACQVTPVPGGPPTADYTFSAQTAYPPQPSSRGTVFLPANQDVIVRIQTGTVTSDPTRLMVMEVDAPAGVRLEVRTAGAQVIGASTDPRFFASTMTAATAAAPLQARPATLSTRGTGTPRDRTMVEPQSVAVVWNCVGPCVAFRPAVGTNIDYYLVIRSPQSRNANIYAYLMEEQDQNEPNNSQATATPVAANQITANVSGAIERLGDSDFFRIAPSGWGSGTVEVDITAATAPGQLDIYVEFLSDNKRVYPGDPPLLASPGEYFVVRAESPTTNAQVAGPAFTSRYNVFVTPVF
jgi:hypothetical protein